MFDGLCLVTSREQSLFRCVAAKEFVFFGAAPLESHFLYITEEIMTRIIIAGSRSFDNYARLEKILNAYIKDPKDVTLISGTAYGADRLGEQYAEKHGIHLIRRPADWALYGKAAGPIRNAEMARLAVADGCHGVLFAFWDGVSTGTQSMIELAKEHGLDVYVVRY